MFVPMHPELQHRMNAIRAVRVPQNLSHRADMWKMAEGGEIVDSENIIRAITRYDILESPCVMQDLFKQHGDLLPSNIDDYDEKVTRLMALLSMEAIAAIMGF